MFVEIVRGFLSTKVHKRITILEKPEFLRDYVDARYLPTDMGGTNTTTARDSVLLLVSSPDR